MAGARSITERVLDVSELLPPEPLEQILATVETIEPGEVLLVKHRQEPCLLYGFLKERGFNSHTRPGRTTTCEVLIWRQSDESVASSLGDLEVNES